MSRPDGQFLPAAPIGRRGPVVRTEDRMSPVHVVAVDDPEGVITPK